MPPIRKTGISSGIRARLPATTRSRVLAGAGRPAAGAQRAPVDDEHQAGGDDCGGQQPGEEQRAGGDRGDGAEREDGDAGRDGFAHRGGGGEDGGALRRVIAFAAEAFVHGDADRGHVGGFGAGDAGGDVHADDRDLQQAAAEMADQGGEEGHDARADAAAVHDEAGEDEEGQSEEDEAAGAALRVAGDRDDAARRRSRRRRALPTEASTKPTGTPMRICRTKAAASAA